MLQKTEGIVISSIPYSDTSIITKILTSQFGLLSFIIKGARGKKSGNKAVLFQPLTVLNLDIYYHENKSLHIIKESKLVFNTSRFHGDVLKTSVVMFISEVLQKLLKDGYQNPALYDLLKSKIHLFIEADFDPDFHLKWLMDMSLELGFLPLDNYSPDEPVFSIEEGKFVHPGSSHTGAYYLSETDSLHFHQLLSGSGLSLSNVERRALLTEIIKYYQYHNPGMAAIKSSSVLQEVL